MASAFTPPLARQGQTQQFSARIAVALQIISDTHQHLREFNRMGFHPSTGMTCKPRRLTAKEKRAFESCLEYLSRIFSTDIGAIPPEEMYSRRVADWLLAADFYVRHYRAVTTVIDLGEQVAGYGEAESPPVVEPYVPSALETSVYEDALSLISQTMSLPQVIERSLSAPLLTTTGNSESMI